MAAVATEWDANAVRAIMEWAVVVAAAPVDRQL